MASLLTEGGGGRTHARERLKAGLPQRLSRTLLALILLLISRLAEQTLLPSRTERISSLSSPLADRHCCVTDILEPFGDLSALDR